MANFPIHVNGYEEYVNNLIQHPKEVVEKLDEYIIGQTHVKKILAIAYLQRCIRVLNHQDIITMDMPIQKNNILLLGQTGSGKTAIVKTLAKVLDIPILVYDITSTTSSGYVGMKIENIIVNYIHECMDHLREQYMSHGEIPSPETIREKALTYAQHGIIYIDEFDKCRKHTESNGRDINGESVQQELLKLLEGQNVNLAEDRSAQKLGVHTFNTENLLIICGGAFAGLQKIISQRLQEKGTIGFQADVNLNSKASQGELFKKIESDDLIKYGFLPEVIGRIAYIVPLDKMTVPVLVDILKYSKTSILQQYKAFFNVFHIELKFTEAALQYIAEAAIKKHTGARALNNIISKILLPLQYDILDQPEGELFISKSYVKKRLKDESLL